MFGGHFSSLNHALAEFEIERFYLSKAVKNEMRMFDALKNDGLTDEQIEKIITEGKYVKFISEKQAKEERKNEQEAKNYVG